MKPSWILWTGSVVATTHSMPIAASFASQPQERIAMLESIAVPTDELLIVKASGDSLSGKFVRCDHDNRLLLIQTFDAGRSRFQSQEIRVDGIRELIVIKERRSAAYPLLGSALLGGLGAAIGYSAGDDGVGGGDVLGEDTRGVTALGFGIAGAATGFVLGAILAPESTTRQVLW